MKRTATLLATGALGLATTGVLAVAVPGVASASGCGEMTVDQTNFSTLFDTSMTRASGHNALTKDDPAGLHVYTDGTTDTGDNGSGGTWNTDKAAGYMTGLSTPLASQTSNDVYKIVYAGTPTGTLPGYQLAVDLDDDGDFDGYLVGEEAYHGDWWLSEQQPGLDDTAAPGAGHGYAHSGTLSQWAAAYPDAVITAFGYSLGSGALGNAVIDKMQFGCNTIDFTYVNHAPTAAFTYKDDGAGKIEFDASGSTDPDGDPIAWFNWDFGDGSGGGGDSASHMSHTYAPGGTYTATLTVGDGAFDDANGTGTVTRTITVAADTLGNTGLPNTGADVRGLAAVAGLALAGGGVGLAMSRRRARNNA